MWGAEDCKNPTGRKLWTRLRGWQSFRCKKTAVCPDCRLIVMPILYYTWQPLINWTAATNGTAGHYFHSCANKETTNHYSQSCWANKNPPATIRTATLPIIIHVSLIRTTALRIVESWDHSTSEAWVRYEYRPLPTGSSRAAVQQRRVHSHFTWRSLSFRFKSMGEEKWTAGQGHKGRTCPL